MTRLEETGVESKLGSQPTLFHCARVSDRKSSAMNPMQFISDSKPFALLHVGSPVRCEALTRKFTDGATRVTVIRDVPSPAVLQLATVATSASGPALVILDCANLCKGLFKGQHQHLVDWLHATIAGIRSGSLANVSLVCCVDFQPVHVMTPFNFTHVNLCAGAHPMTVVYLSSRVSFLNRQQIWDIYESHMIFASANERERRSLVFDLVREQAQVYDEPLATVAEAVVNTLAEAAAAAAIAKLREQARHDPEKRRLLQANIAVVKELANNLAGCKGNISNLVYPVPTQGRETAAAEQPCETLQVDPKTSLRNTSCSIQ
jgi:hypothetical protein